MLGIALASPFLSSAAAEPGWLKPLNLSTPGQAAEAPQVALDAAGDATAVWLGFDGSNLIVQSATRPAGGAWSAPVGLSAPGEDAEGPQLALDAAGDAVVVWSRFDGAESGTHSIVQAASRPAGGSWGPPVDLSAAERNAEQPQVALDARGDATAVWLRFNGSYVIVQAASRLAGGAWGEPVDLSASGHNGEDPQVALDAAGDATVVWSRFNGANPTSNSIVQAASRLHGGAWEAAVDVSEPGQNAEAPQVAVDSAGTATAVWSRSNGTDLIVQAADRPLGGPWGAAGDLSGPGRSATTPQVAVNAAGAAAAVWSRANGAGTTIVQGAARPAAGGAWGSPGAISALGGLATIPQVGINAGGEAIAVWLFSDGAPSVISSSIRPPGGPWQSPIILSGLGKNSAEPQLGLDPGGNGLAAWNLEDGPEHVIQAIGLDGAPPELRSLSVAPAATIGQSAPFSVAPFDIWSPIGSVTWSFDDGSTAEGPAVSHVFSSLGVHSVSVTSADELGNLTGTMGSVTVYPGARAGHNAPVRRGGAQLRLYCPSPAGCEGRLRLIAIARVERHGRRVQIGATAFEVAGEQAVTVGAPLSARGVALVREAMPKGLKAQLTGPGVRHRLVVLRIARASGAS